MKIQIKAHHIELTPALREHAEKKIEKLDRFFEQIQEIIIDLDVSHTSSDDEKQIASAVILASGTVIRGQETSASLYASIDLLVDKLEVQLKKHKEKLKQRNRQGSHRTLETAHKDGKTRSLSTFDAEERFIPKPMDPEDAATILERDKLSFLVFRDMEEKICVLYPIGNHEYGLVETA